MALHHACSHIRKSADISAICASPQLIAACHVLLRLLMPRHSPYALLRLNFLDLSIFLGSRLSELLEFLQIFGIIFRVKGFPFTLLFSSSTSVKSFTLFGKTYLRILLPFTLASKICPLICSFLLFLSLYSVFNEHILIAHSPPPLPHSGVSEGQIACNLSISKKRSAFPRNLWSVWMDSNHRPRAYQARALTT